ncbi:MAG: hypothetical protein H6739_13170 [Alphaproteobacteria bacterium]|nr:hypothetical protein [Alphaproteobacteria bacterium]
MSVWLWLPLATAALTLFAVALVRLPPTPSAIAVNLVALAVLTGAMLAGGWFEVSKMTAIVATAEAVVVFRSTGLGNSTGFRWLVLGGLVVNILIFVGLEASIRGVTLNVLAGSLILATLSGPGAFAVSEDLQRRLSYDLSLAWVLAYSTWDVNFFFFIKDMDTGERTGTLAALGVAQALASLLACGFRAKDYLAGRMFVMLGIGVLVVVVPFEPWLVRSPGWRIPAVEQALHALALGLTLAALVQSILRARRGELPRNLVERALAVGRS